MRDYKYRVRSPYRRRYLRERNRQIKQSALLAFAAIAYLCLTILFFMGASS